MKFDAYDFLTATADDYYYFFQALAWLFGSDHRLEGVEESVRAGFMPTDNLNPVEDHIKVCLHNAYTDSCENGLYHIYDLGEFNKIAKSKYNGNLAALCEACRDVSFHRHAFIMFGNCVGVRTMSFYDWRDVENNLNPKLAFEMEDMAGRIIVSVNHFKKDKSLWHPYIHEVVRSLRDEDWRIIHAVQAACEEQIPLPAILNEEE